MKRLIHILFVAFVVFFGAAPVFAGGGHDHGHGHGHGEGEHDEPERGPHGGRLLSEGDLALEMTIFEDDVPPQYRIYPYYRKRPIAPEKVSVRVELTRFGGKKDEFVLTPSGEFLTSSKIVEEPHSFDVLVEAEHEGKHAHWEYESYEGRTTLSDTALKVANLELDIAGPKSISNDFRVYGKLLPNENRVAHLVPRFPGIIREIRKELGDKVAKGEVLAVVESNQGLQPYEIRSQVEGVVIKRHATLGEFVSDEREIFIVADLSEIWADFQVYRDDFGAIETGQKIVVDLGDGKEIPAVVRYASPVTDEVTQSRLIRAVLPNPSSTLRPGLFVSAVLSSSHGEVPIAVKRDAIQTFRDWSVVYLTDGHVFQAMPVELGRKDSKFVEIRSGISAGDRYVSRHSFIIKADIEKSGASHDH